jgi:flagellar hook-associated protein 1 FlgK
MSGLLSALQISSTALQAFTQALGIDQANIANASTPGYAAQKATILPIGSNAPGSNNGDLISLNSTGNSLTDAQVQAGSSEASFSQTQTQQLAPINQLFDITGSSGILAAFQQFSTAFSNLSVTPNDPTLGAAALSAAGNVASAFQTAANGLAGQREQLDTGIQSTVKQINTLSANIRQLNAQVSASGQPNPNTDASLRSNLDQLSTLVDITVTRAPDGGVSVLAGGQLPLVIGNQSFALSANPSAAPGSQLSSTGGGNSPASFSGQLGALLETRNGALTQLLGGNGQAGTLNTLAAGFASRVNTLLSSGNTAAGTPGVPIFTYDTTNPANGAASLSLDPNVTSPQLGLATTGANGVANGIANQLAGLPASNAATDQINGLSAEGLFGSIAASVGQQLADATNASASDHTNLTSAQTSRQQQSGVSLDQEAATITAYQRSYQANAQVISILNQLTQDTINLITSTAG